jgi:beta-lactam-binding protein with PASTA domain
LAGAPLGITWVEEGRADLNYQSRLPTRQFGRSSIFFRMSIRLALSAEVTYCKAPDVRGKRAAKAAQLIAAADCTPKISKRKVKKRRKRNRVIRQLTPAGTTGAPGTPVEIVVGKTKKK